MSAPDESRLDALFVRYWDDALAPAEVEELAALLAVDAVAREGFRLLCAQAVAAAELPAYCPPLPEPASAELARAIGPVPAAPAVPSEAPAAPARERRLTRRGLLGLAGGALAAGVGGLAFFRWPRGPSETHVALTAQRGTIRVYGANGQPLPASGSLHAGATVSTEGVGAAVTLRYPDGSSISLIGDAAVTVGPGGRDLRLHRGTASVELCGRVDEADRITLATNLLTLPKLGAAQLMIGQSARASEVEVQRGTVSVSAPGGEPLTVVRAGEMLTVRPNGDRHQRPTPVTPEEFAWDFTTPTEWVVGQHVAARDSLVRAVAWSDPYYSGAEMYQIRSENPWARGYFRLAEGSEISVRYRAARACPRGQMCFCVRTPDVHCPETGMLEYNGGFAATASGAWGELRVRAAEMRDSPLNRHPPAFGPPWVAFLVIFNTFEENIGLEIAELRVSPGKNPA